MNIHLPDLRAAFRYLLGKRSPDHAKDLAFALLERENALLRARWRLILPKNRPHWTPAHRADALAIMRLRGERKHEAAARFGVSMDTIKRWLRLERLGTGGDVDAVAPNRLPDALRRMAHILHAAYPHVGTRRLTDWLNRHVRISRSSVQNILREKPPKGPASKAQVTTEVAPAEPFGPLRPEAVNDAWHTDLTCLLPLPWKPLVLIAVMDGFSRKCLKLRLLWHDPDTDTMMDFLKEAMKKFGKPKAICTDHGGQFKLRFKKALASLGITHAQGKPRNPKFNGKAERFFRSLKWELVKAALWLPVKRIPLQMVLDDWADWYNTERPHQALGGRTPDEVWHDRDRRPPLRLRARDKLDIRFTITKASHRGLTCCPTPFIEVTVRHPNAA